MSIMFTVLALLAVGSLHFRSDRVLGNKDTEE